MSLMMQIDAAVNGESVAVVNVFEEEGAGQGIRDRRIRLDDSGEVDGLVDEAELTFGPDAAGRLRTLLDGEAKRALQVRTNNVPTAAELDAPAPIPLDSRVVPPLPPDVFTGWLGDMIDAVAAATETPPDLAAMYSLAVLATVCQKRFSVRVQQDYFEQLNIWTVCALPPGMRKSAVIKVLTAPLIEWEKRQAAKVGAERQLAESIYKTMEGRIAELRAQAKKKEGPELESLATTIAEMEAALPTIPEIPRRLTQDCTPEHLGTMMALHGECMSVLSDEGGIFDLWGGRYSNNVPNLDLMLQAFTGTFVRVDRGSRLPVMLNHPALTLGLSPQPDVLAGLTKHKGFRGRGLIGRILYSVPVSRLGYRTLEPHPIPDHITRAYNEAIDMLADVAAEEHPRVLTLSAAAWNVWKAQQRAIETMMQEGADLADMTDVGGKMPGAVARVAGLLHVADHASCPETVTEISGDTMERAVRLGDYLIQHAQAAYDLMGADGDMDAARKLWKVIEGRRMHTFTAREAWHPLRGTYRRASDVDGAFQVLIDHAHIEEQHTAEYQKRGRPSRTFTVNPIITRGWQ